MNAKKVGLGLLDTIVKVAFIIFIAMFIIKYAKVGYSYGYQIFNQTPVSTGTGRTVSVTIVTGDSASTIADKLASKGLIKDKFLFKLQEKFSEYSGKEVPGTYELSTSMTPEEMIQIMSSGNETLTQEGSDENSDMAPEGISEVEPVPQETESSANPEENSGD